MYNNKKICIIPPQKVDLNPFGMTPTPERMKMFDMTPPAFCEGFNIMVKWPEETSRLTLVARPFDWAVSLFNNVFNQ